MRRSAGQRFYYYLAPFQERAAAQTADLDTFFWSGLGDATELKAAELSGSGLGVAMLTRKEAVPIGRTMVGALRKIPTSTPIFLDSGAFGAERGGLDLDTLEVRDQPAWDFILHTYRQIAKGRQRGRVFVVAPDKVGSQAQTLKRLRIHAAQVRDLGRHAIILVAIQPGKMTPWDFADEVDRLLGPRWVPALPLVDQARALRYFTPEVLEAFVERRRPSRIHLLGAGPARPGKSGRAQSVIPPLRRAAQRMHLPLRIQADAALTRGMTAAIRKFREGIAARYPPDELELYQVGAGVWEVPGSGVTWHFDETEDWPEAFDALSRKERGEVGKRLIVAHYEPGPSSLTKEEVRAFVASPSRFLRNPPRALSSEDRWFFGPLTDRLVGQMVYARFAEQYGARALSLRSAGLERLQAAPQRPWGAETIGLVACGACKDAPGRQSDWRGPARELYTGSLFRDQRGYVEDRGVPYFILSAKHGLLEPTEEVGRYEQRMSSKQSQRSAWANKVFTQLQRRLGTVRGRRFELHAGRDYLNPLATLLQRAGARVDTPVRGKNIFELRSFYRRQRV